MSSAWTTAEIQRDPKDNKRKKHERKVRELHEEGLPSISHYILQVKLACHRTQPAVVKLM